MSLKEMLIKFMSQYSSELADAKANEDYKRPFGDLGKRQRWRR